jgi:hypothetical protein
LNEKIELPVGRRHFPFSSSGEVRLKRKSIIEKAEEFSLSRGFSLSLSLVSLSHRVKCFGGIHRFQKSFLRDTSALSSGRVSISPVVPMAIRAKFGWHDNAQEVDRQKLTACRTGNNVRPGNYPAINYEQH